MDFESYRDSSFISRAHKYDDVKLVGRVGGVNPTFRGANE
jgi:hypothetical protein